MNRAPTPFGQPIYVTRPMLPPLNDYTELLKNVWASGWLANGGAQHLALEGELEQWLQVPHLSLFNNGTIALLVACQALNLQGEVITTPFTFPATPHVLNWNNITPVFADIDPDTLCLDPASVESRVTSGTTGILGVHVYGVPCDVNAIADIAQRHHLRVVYDGAHAFGTQIDGQAIGTFGDATMFSFHATKLFHTAEGGALAVNDPALKERVELLKNFGIKNENEVVLPGINGKMSELQAALGRVVLRSVAEERQRRMLIRRVYEQRLADVCGLRLQTMPAGVTDSLQYLVLRVGSQSGCSRDALHERLKTYNIITRKYFNPLCSEYSCYRHLPSAQPANLPNAHRVASEALVLPLYGALEIDDVHRICDAILHCLRT